MKSSEFFGVIAAIYIAPHVSTPVAVGLALVFGALGLLMRYWGND